MLPVEIFKELKQEFGDSIIEFKELHPGDPFIVIGTEKLFDICHTLRDKEEFLFDYLMSLSGMDLGDNLGVVYHLYSMFLKNRTIHCKDCIYLNLFEYQEGIFHKSGPARKDWG